MRKYVLVAMAIWASMRIGVAQTLEKMCWVNEPERWEVKDGKLTMFVTPQSDYWRISHYGFTVDDAPFYYAEYGGEFEAKVKITGDYKTRFDQAGLMIRVDHRNYIKTGIEFVDGKFNLSAVVTHDKEYVMMRNAWLQDNTPVRVGLMGACPDGQGFNVTFEHFQVRHLPDQRRLEWLMKNQAE